MKEARSERERWRRAQDLFHRARELEPERRSDFLRVHCEGDAALRDEVDALLAEATEGPAAPELDDLSGTTLGHYELLRIIGEGSMGVIYEARQRYVERHVALKTLRQRSAVLAAGGTLESHRHLARRFAAEAEVLGRLDHPGIVPIHEMEHEAGIDYFTMRLVHGDDVRDVIERVHAGSWPRERALGVLLRACETMAFAHAKGVVHRDLKPAHVMVGRFGEVYIVDWGLAKLPHRETESEPAMRRSQTAPSEDPSQTSALQTLEGEVLGTPAYMAPEQARGSVRDVGPRADVYAMGAMLYHLLAGHPPHVGPRGDASRQSARDVLEAVRAGPPPALDRRATRAPAPLVAIVDKAMARRPEARYPNMESVADDLRAFLEHRVVAAHRTGAGIELLTWLRRNVLAAAALGLTLFVALGWLANVVWIRTRQNEALAEAVQLANDARDRAQERSDYATATNTFLGDVFRTAHPVQAQGREVTMKEALDTASTRLDETAQEQPHVEASLRRTLGVAYRQLGALEEAERHLRLAYETLPELLGRDHPDSLLATGDYGLLLVERGELARADELLSEALERNRAVYGSDDRRTLRALAGLAQLKTDQRRADEALALGTELLETQLRVYGADHPDLGTSYEILGTAYYDLDQLDEAERNYRLELEANLRHFGPDHSNTLVATTNVASVLDAKGRYEEALEMSLDLAERVHTVFGPRHRTTLNANTNLALILVNLGQLDDGLALLEEALLVQREELGPEHLDTLQTTRNLAAILRHHERFEASLPLYETLLAHHREHLATDDARFQLTLLGLADGYLHQGRHADAVPLLTELLELQRTHPGHIAASDEATVRWLESCYEALEDHAALAALRNEEAARSGAD